MPDVTLDYSSPAAHSRPLAELLSLAAPTIAQMASYTVMQFSDTLMLAHVGDAEATAGGLGSMVAFSFISFGVGALLLVNTLVSQSFGRGDHAACGRYMWQGIWFAVGFAALTAPLLPFVGPLFRGLGHTPHLAAMEASFVRISLAAAVLKLSQVALGQFLLATNRPHWVLLAAVCAAVVNVGVNFVLIFGRWGIPPLGVTGAAIGTAIAVTVELLILAAVVWRSAASRKFNVFDWLPRRELMGQLLKVGLPSGLQIVAEVVAWSLFSIWVVALFDERSMAATNYTFRFMSISFMPVFGLSAAVTALVGRYIGMGRPDIAAKRAHLGFAVAVSYTVLCGILFYVLRHRLMHLFTHDPVVLRLGAMLLIFAAAYQIFDAMYMMYSGALRGAGDTFVPAVVIACMCWGITVLGGYFVGRTWPQWGVAGPWAAALGYGIILGIYLMLRFVRGRWKSIRLSPEISNPAESSTRVGGFPVLTES